MRSTLFVLLAVGAIAVGVGPMGVGAQATDAPVNVSNATDAATNATDEIVGTEDPTQAEIDTLANRETVRIDQSARIVGWEFGAGKVRVGLEADRRTPVTIADGMAGMDSAGAVTVPKTTYLVERDEAMVVDMNVTEVQGGSAVGVSSRGTTIRLSTEMGGDDPFRYFGGESGLFTGMIMAILSSIGGAGYVLWREDSGVQKA